MKYTVLFTAPYMIPFVDRFRPVFDNHDIELIVPDVRERMEEDHLLKYAGHFDGAICGDDRFTARVIEACLPRLKVISKWGTGVDSIDAEACSRHSIRLGTLDIIVDAHNTVDDGVFAMATQMNKRGLMHTTGFYPISGSIGLTLTRPG